MVIDHINGNKLDNRLNNLRLVTSGQNAMNSGMSSRNTNGYRGVIQVQNRYRARIRYQGKLLHLGYYDSFIKAAKVYDKKARELFGAHVFQNIMNRGDANHAICN